MSATRSAVKTLVIEPVSNKVVESNAAPAPVPPATIRSPSGPRTPMTIPCPGRGAFARGDQPANLIVRGQAPVVASLPGRRGGCDRHDRKDDGHAEGLTP
jgi:hypothetical protein